MQIILAPIERDKLTATAEILRKYSRMFSAMVEGETGMHFDEAATAAGILENLVKETNKATKAD